MRYLDLCKTYSMLESTSKGLEKTSILANFLEKIKNNPEYIYLFQGRVFADWDERTLGISEQLAIRAISKATGLKDSEVVGYFKKFGDLGKAVEEIFKKKKIQKSLFSSTLSIRDVFIGLRMLVSYEGPKSIDKKLDTIVNLLNSASPLEARYIIRTVIGDLKIGVGNGIIRDAIVEWKYSPKTIKEKKVLVQKVQEAYDKVTDFAEVFARALKGTLDKVELIPGRPIKVMLYPKARDIEDAFSIVGRPAAFEFKYDGFRVIITKDKESEVKIFTRRFENITTQFPDILWTVKNNVKAKSFILDGEAVGYDSKTKKYTEFQAISQRIRRKYGIKEMSKKLPVELVLFDILYLDGKSLIKEPFKKRRRVLEKIVRKKPFSIRLAEQIISDSEKEVEKFYQKALNENQEGLMGKNLNAPYKPGARVGYGVKIKPEDNEFDLVITGAEWGTGKRAGWLTSFDVSAQDIDGNLIEVGKVSTGLKEKKEEGLSFEEMTNRLKGLIIEEKGRWVKVRPEVVVTVAYQNIQKSPTYSSGYALRFPRIKRLREDRGVLDIARIEEIKREYENSIKS